MGPVRALCLYRFFPRGSTDGKSGVAQKCDEIVGVVSVRKNRDAESIIDGGIYAICLLRDLRLRAKPASVSERIVS